MKNKLPDGWKEVELGDVLDYEQPTDYIVSSEDYNDENKTPVLTAGKSFILGYTDETKGIYTKSPVIIFDDFTTASHYVNFPFKVKSSAMKFLTPKTKEINLKYIFWLMQTIKVNSESHKRYYLSKYQYLKIPLPPLPIQQKIVSILEKAEKAKELRKEADELTKDFLKSVFLEMFGEYIYNEKKQVEIKEVCFVKGGKRLPKGELFSNIKTNRPYIRVTDMINLSINLDKLKYIHEDLFKKIKNYTISKEDVYITIAGTTGLTGTIPEKLNGASLTENAAKLVIKDKTKLDKLFLAYVLSTDYCKSQLEKNTYQVGVPKLALFRIETCKIPLPPLPLQQKFASIVKEVEAIKEHQKHSKEQIDKLFNALMQKAFKGEIYV